MKIGDKFFVYGTLMRGFHNHRVIDGLSEFVKETTLPGAKIYSLGPFPGLRPGTGTVVGELFTATTEDAIRGMDRLEGHPTFYRREVMETADGPAWVYIYQGQCSDERAIQSGNWKDVA